MSALSPPRDFSEAVQVDEAASNIITIADINDYVADGHVQRIGIPKVLRDKFSEIIDREAGKSDPALIKLVKGLMIVLQDKHRQLEKSGYDPLTNALNLIGLGKELDRAQRYPARQYATIFIDLDGFKEVNDNCGHKAGDEALIEVIDRLNTAFFEKDMVVRKGGDEIVLVLPFDGNDEFDEATVTEKIRSTLAGLYKRDRNGAPFPIGASIGTDVFNTADLPHGALLSEAVNASIARADARMYEDKWGPNQMHKTPDGKNPRAPKNRRLEAMREAIMRSLGMSAGASPEAFNNNTLE